MSSHAMQHIQHLSMTIGPRGSTTPQEKQAAEYARQQFEALGLETHANRPGLRTALPAGRTDRRNRCRSADAGHGNLGPARGKFQAQSVGPIDRQGPQPERLGAAASQGSGEAAPSCGS